MIKRYIKIININEIIYCYLISCFLGLYHNKSGFKIINLKEFHKALETLIFSLSFFNLITFLALIFHKISTKITYFEALIVPFFQPSV